MGILTFVFAGCGKAPEESPSSEPASNSPSSYMKDPAFMQKLESRRAVQKAIVAERQPLLDRMAALVRAHGEGKAAELPEWQALKQRVDGLNARYEKTRLEQLALLRERMAPSKEHVSK